MSREAEGSEQIGARLDRRAMGAEDVDEAAEIAFPTCAVPTDGAN